MWAHYGLSSHLSSKVVCGCQKCAEPSGWHQAPALSVFQAQHEMPGEILIHWGSLFYSWRAQGCLAVKVSGRLAGGDFVLLMDSGSFAQAHPTSRPSQFRLFLNLLHINFVEHVRWFELLQRTASPACGLWFLCGLPTCVTLCLHISGLHGLWESCPGMQYPGEVSHPPRLPSE